MRKRLVFRIIFTLVVILAALPVFGVDYPANPNIADRRVFLADPAGAVDARSAAEINARLYQLRQKTTAEMGVAVVPSLDGEEIQPYSVGLFQEWGLGQDDNDNGVLLVISIGDRRAFITTGYGVEGALPDISCNNIARRIIAPKMKEGDVGGAVLGAVDAVYGALTDPAVAEELRSEKGVGGQGQQLKALDKEALYSAITYIAGFILLLTILLFIYLLIQARHGNGYEKAQMWRKWLPYFWAGAALSLGTALPFALLALFLYKSGRNKRIRCQTCGARMNKLSEEKDNELLSLSQDFEEQIGSVDYDVWLCPNCGTVERFPFIEKNTKYTECPKCHTHAFTLRCERQIQAPTTRREGIGVREYECLFCHHKENRNYRIPRRPDDSAAAALAAGALLGGMGRGGGGGGGFGGGFGGGSTGGGGGGAGW